MRRFSISSFTSYEWIILGFSTVGIMLSAASLIIMSSVMNGFRKELLAKVTDANKQLPVQVLEVEQQIMWLILMLSVVVVVLGLLSALIILRKATVSGQPS